MRILVGAILGLVLGAAAVAAAGVAIPKWSYLAVLAAGVVAGLVMRSVASGGGSIYAKGAMAGLATALAAIAGPLVATQWFQIQGSSQKLDKTVAVADAGSAETTGEVDEAAVVEVAPPVTTSVPTATGPAGLGSPAGNPFAPIDVACLAVGCLIAYQVGKGSPAAAKADDEPEGSPQPAEPAADASDGVVAG